MSEIFDARVWCGGGNNYIRILIDNGFNTSFEMGAGFVSENDKSVEIIFWVFHRVWPFLGWKLLGRVW